VNTFQGFITRLFNLSKPIDKRLIWAALGLLALFSYLLLSGMNDGSGSASVDATSSGSDKSAISGTWQTDDANGFGAKGSASNTGNMGVTTPGIYVHIVGLVKHPGLYRLESGARVADAVFAADGFLPKADQSSINLARLLTDGEQIDVAGPGSSTGSQGRGNNVGATASNGLININRADQASVESLPSVGPTLAARIIDWRLANGGFKSKADLKKVAGIGDKLFAKLKDLVAL